GRKKMRLVARGLRRLRVAADTLVTSPLPRAAETAAILAAEHGGLPAPVELDALATGMAPAEMLRALRRFGEGDLMVVGHEPSLSGLAALLLTGSPDGVAIALRKGGVIALELDRLAPRRATLLWMSTPRALRRLGRRVSAARQGRPGRPAR
ncbi:MAG TPA: histidine phosphatase family protein, partial [Candidatus Limnocylindria bacterium]|nr:histidine phosphatase family protein [Candidatus Limnocylindria bacterium]